jgi:zinc transporter ZupT
MNKSSKMFLATIILLVITGCATIGGGLVGAGIGAIAGDAKMGAAVGATTGAVIDIFGH